MSRVVTVTVNPALDKNTTVRQLVAERKIKCERPRREPGGGGVNVARAIRRLGGEATALWSRGGATGEMFEMLFGEEEIPQQPIPIDEPTRENFIVYEHTSERQYRFGMPGPHLTQRDLARWLEAIDTLDPPPDFVVASGSLPPGVPEDFYVTMQAHLPDACRFIVDSRGEALQAVIRTGVFLVKPNLRELEALVGELPQNDIAIRQRARAIIANGGAEVIVVSLGSAGALLVTADQTEHLRSPTVPIRSKVGAGDSMLAGIVHTLASGRSVQESVAYGVAAGAAAVMTSGTELCRQRDVQTLHGQMVAEKMVAKI
jgi:6-phosphofructokinase 2